MMRCEVSASASRRFGEQLLELGFVHKPTEARSASRTRHRSSHRGSSD
jgi:hypothetical protein